MQKCPAIEVMATKFAPAAASLLVNRVNISAEDDILILAAVLAIHLTEDAEREKTEISARQNDVGTRLSERNAPQTISVQRK
jgi:hypothetical protein